MLFSKLVRGCAGGRAGGRQSANSCGGMRSGQSVRAMHARRRRVCACCLAAPSRSPCARICRPKITGRVVSKSAPTLMAAPSAGASLPVGAGAAGVRRRRPPLCAAPQSLRTCRAACTFRALLGCARRQPVLPLPLPLPLLDRHPAARGARSPLPRGVSERPGTRPGLGAGLDRARCRGAPRLGASRVWLGQWLGPLRAAVPRLNHGASGGRIAAPAAAGRLQAPAEEELRFEHRAPF